MGTILRGILGGFSGKIGNVIGSSWLGVDYMKSLPRKSKKPPTINQLTSRAKFALAGKFLNDIAALISVGFQSHKKNELPMNAAMSYHIEKAITGVYPDFEMDYPKVKISKGSLMVAYLPEMDTVVGGKLKIDWVNNSPAVPGNTNATDQLTVVVYNPVKDMFVSLVGVATRLAETYTMQLPMSFVGDEVHAWMGFVSASGKKVSDSNYLGEVEVV